MRWVLMFSASHLSSLVALMFLAAKQSLFRQCRRGKTPNYPGRQACCPVQPHNYARGMHIIHTLLFYPLFLFFLLKYILFFYFSLSRSKPEDVKLIRTCKWQYLALWWFMEILSFLVLRSFWFWSASPATAAVTAGSLLVSVRLARRPLVLSWYECCAFV